MKRLRLALAGTVAALLMVTLGGCAGNEESARLTPGDVDLMNRTAQQALEGNKIGQSSNWDNPASGHRGTVTPLRTYDSDAAAPCRDYQQTVSYASRSLVAVDRACRGEAGTWRSARYRVPAGYDSFRRLADDPPHPYHPYGYYPYGPYHPHFGLRHRHRFGLHTGFGYRL